MKHIPAKTKTLLAFGVVLALFVGLPLFVWAVITQRFELRKQAAENSNTEYSITSSDGQVRIVFDSKFGGAITKIFDYQNFGNTNLIDNNQAGAMFQNAFWAGPVHNYQPPYVSGNPRLPPNCSGANDEWWDNPTQAGFVADGLAGNPIGVMGTDYGIIDPNEFIRYENAGASIHFKSRFIRYDYCKSGNALSPDRPWWDTGFYIEQTAYFHPQLPHVLVLKSRISYEDTNYPNFAVTWQLPIIFAHNLPQVAYIKNDNLTITSNQTAFDPDQTWAAILDANKNAGIGMVIASTTKALKEHLLGASNVGSDAGGEIDTLGIGGWTDWRQMGTLNNVSYNNQTFIFSQGGTFDWVTYHPIGQLSQIRSSANSLLSNWTNNPPPPTNYISQINGNVDTVSCTWAAGWARDERNLPNKLDITAIAYPQGEPDNKYRVSAKANGTRSDLTGVCPPSGDCAFGASWNTFPPSFINKTLTVDVYGVASDGKNLITNNSSNSIGPCPNILQSSPTLPPTPPLLPGDLNGDGKVDIFDYNLLVTDFGKTGAPGFSPADLDTNGKVDIFDYNMLVGNFGKTQ